MSILSTATQEASDTTMSDERRAAALALLVAHLGKKGAQLELVQPSVTKQEKETKNHGE